MRVCACACARACVRACVRARACVRVRARACACVRMRGVRACIFLQMYFSNDRLCAYAIFSRVCAHMSACVRVRPALCINLSLPRLSGGTVDRNSARSASVSARNSTKVQPSRLNSAHTCSHCCSKGDKFILKRKTQTCFSVGSAMSVKGREASEKHLKK